MVGRSESLRSSIHLGVLGPTRRLILIGERRSEAWTWIHRRSDHSLIYRCDEELRPTLVSSEGNKIKSISILNPAYIDAIQRGCKLPNAVGFALPDGGCR